MNFLKRLLSGIGIGIGAAIPGVSGAAIAVICHVYEDIIEAVSSFRKKFGWSLKVLIPIVLGVVIAVVPCIYLFSLAFEHLMFVLICIFAGFLIGSLPSVKDKVKDAKPNKVQWIIIIISIIFVIVLGVLSVFLGPTIKLNSSFDAMPAWLYIVLIPVGILAAVALTVPGLSGSLILLVIGFYRPMVDHVKDWASLLFKEGSMEALGKLVGLVGCFGIGCIIGIVLISKLMKSLLAKHHDSTYFAIIGFIIGSLFVLFFNYEIYNYYLYWAGVAVEGVKINPSLPIYIETPLGIIILIGCAFASYFIISKANKNMASKKPY